LRENPEFSRNPEFSHNPDFSHNGIRDDLTHSVAPPLFYLHVDRMIAGCMRNGNPFSLIYFTLPSDCTSVQLLDLAHSISLSMRKEDLCGRLGRHQFNVALGGDIRAGQELCRRVHESFPSEVATHSAQWQRGESALDLFYRLDQLSEM
jgi:hypothetical protein